MVRLTLEGKIVPDTDEDYTTKELSDRELRIRELTRRCNDLSILVSFLLVKAGVDRDIQYILDQNESWFKELL